MNGRDTSFPKDLSTSKGFGATFPNGVGFGSGNGLRAGGPGSGSEATIEEYVVEHT